MDSKEYSNIRNLIAVKFWEKYYYRMFIGSAEALKAGQVSHIKNYF